eukprot:6703979-Lingulodinium_polyedra.AAC.1
MEAAQVRVLNVIREVGTRGAFEEEDTPDAPKGCVRNDDVLCPLGGGSPERPSGEAAALS